jgi:MFS family permease
MGGFSVSRALFVPIIGWLSDQKGRKNILCLGLLTYSILSLAYILAERIPELIAVRLINGAVSGMIVPVASAWLGDIAPEGEEGNWMGYFNAVFFTGAGFLADHFGISSAFYTMAGVNFIAFLAVFFMVPGDSKRKIVSKSRLSFRKMSSSFMFRGLFFNRTMVELSMTAFFTFLPIFAGINLGLSNTLIGVLMAANLMLLSLLQLFSGKIADRFNKRNVLIWGNLISFIPLLLIPLSTGFWHLMGIVIIRSFGSAISLPVLSVLSIQEGRKFGMASTIGALSIATSIGMGVGPVVSGMVADFFNIQSVFYFSAIMGFIGLIMFVLYSRQRTALEVT